MRKSKARNGQVVTYCGYSQMAATVNIANGGSVRVVSQGHESVTRSRMAERLAALKGYEFAGEYNRTTVYDTLYFVPADTLLLDDARQLGIRSGDQLFGGCVAEPFMACKTITHPLIDEKAVAPPGWTTNFATAVKGVALNGYSVFSVADARRAATELLKTDRVRLKPALGIGGAGQTVIEHIDELDAPLAEIPGDILARYGVVLEQDLEWVTTYSVGSAHIAGQNIAYHGQQTLTENHQGKKVYGGSSLQVVRGTLHALRQLELPVDIEHAIEQAIAFDAAADSHLPGFFASRRNYDVVQGIDRDGRPRAGVLEQSWRIGGASPAEIARSKRLRRSRIYAPLMPPPMSNTALRSPHPRPTFTFTASTHGSAPSPNTA